jgi:hypothetical protein
MTVSSECSCGARGRIQDQWNDQVHRQTEERERRTHRSGALRLYSAFFHLLITVQLRPYFDFVGGARRRIPYKHSPEETHSGFHFVLAANSDRNHFSVEKRESGVREPIGTRTRYFCNSF